MPLNCMLKKWSKWYILCYVYFTIQKKSNVGKCISLKMQILLKRDQLTRNVLRSPLKHTSASPASPHLSSSSQRASAEFFRSVYTRSQGPGEKPRYSFPSRPSHKPPGPTAKSFKFPFPFLAVTPVPASVLASWQLSSPSPTATIQTASQ